MNTKRRNVEELSVIYAAMFGSAAPIGVAFDRSNLNKAFLSHKSKARSKKNKTEIIMA